MTLTTLINYPRIIELTELDGIHEIHSYQTYYVPLVIEDNRLKLIIRDVNLITQDLALSCWFSQDAYFRNIRFNYKDRCSVQQTRQLEVSIKSDQYEISEPSISLDAQTVSVPNGVYYFNIENRAGGKKRFTIQIEDLGEVQ